MRLSNLGSPEISEGSSSEAESPPLDDNHYLRVPSLDQKSHSVWTQTLPGPQSCEAKLLREDLSISANMEVMSALKTSKHV